MRRISIEKKIWLDRQVAKLKARNLKLAGIRRHTAESTNSRVETVVLQVPGTLTAESQEHRAKILDLIEQMVTCLQRGHARVKLDFSKARKLYPGGMLVLLAALERLVELFPGKLSARCPPHSLARQLLSHFDLAEALGVCPAFSQPRHESVIRWRYLTGDQAGGEEVKTLLDEYRAICEADIPPELFSVLTEALTNVRNHAYPEEQDTRLPHSLRRWWLFARYDAPAVTKQGHLYIAIYDIGVGIPSTMRTKLKKGEVVLDVVDRVGELLLGAHGSQLDQELLKVAVEHRRSQTGQAHRGRGLPEMREFVAMTPGARLYIVSGKAQYSYIRDRGCGYTNGSGRQFPGTLLLWSLPLNAKEQHA